MQKLVVPLAVWALISVAAPSGPIVDASDVKALESATRTAAAALIYDRNIQSDQYAIEYTFDDSWLADVEIQQQTNVDLALDTLYDHLDNLLMFQRYFEVDWLLSQIVVSKFTVEVLIGFLSVTFFYRKHLRTRSSFYGKIKSHLQQINRYSDALLSGLAS